MKINEKDIQIICASNNFAIDSREVKPGACFFALPGCNACGEDFLDDASRNGAGLAVVSFDVEAHKSLKLIRVACVFEALRAVASYKRKQFRGKVIAITGSNGKTTIKEYVQILLSRKFHVEYTKKSWNSKISVPLSFLTFSIHADIWIVEAGVSFPSEMKSHIDLIKPHICVIANIGSAHVGNYGSFEMLAREKCHITFSTGCTDVVMLESDFDSWNKYVSAKPKYTLVSKCHDHSKTNTKIVTAVVDLCDASECIRVEEELSVSMLPGRMETVFIDGVQYVNDAYNYSLESLEALCSHLSNIQGQKCIIISSLKEAGIYKKKMERKGASVISAVFSHSIVVGDDNHDMGEYLMEEGVIVKKSISVYSVIEHLEKIVEQCSVVAIKGSNTSRLYTLTHMISKKNKEK